MFKTIFLFFLIIFIYKLINCISDLIRITKYRNLYLQFSKDINENFLQYSKLSVDLLKKLGIKESFTNGGVSPVLTNISMKNGLIIHHVKNNFESAIGVAKYNLKQCFNPLYWINLLLFLPKNIFIYLNISAESIFVKISQVLYWIITTLIAIFSSDIANWIKSIIHF